jgi:lipopolysaccharide/colanic/teichoic acid biosynthesis glycosyltransferase
VGGFVIKPGVDFSLAGLLLVLLLPFFAVIAMLVALDSEGPVLFRQPRMGRYFRRFTMFKFRTMRWCDSGSMFTLGADVRITRVGRWLRRTKLDELPQLWNVLRGEMSLVGPRPVIPELTREFRAGYRSLLRVRPGLTDPATLKYRNETEMLARVPDPLQYFKTVVTPDKIRISREYLRDASLTTDMGVIVQTAIALLVSQKASEPIMPYAPEAERKSA